MNDKLKIRYVVSTVLVCCVVLLAGLTATTSAQEPSVAAKPVTSEKSSGRDPFKKFEPVRKATKGTAAKLEPPSIQVRIDRYRAQKLAAANAHVSPPKPTTALLLNEMQVTGIVHHEAQRVLTSRPVAKLDLPHWRTGASSALASSVHCLIRAATTSVFCRRVASTFHRHGRQST
jgi:hypothetical protein